MGSTKAPKPILTPGKQSFKEQFNKETNYEV